MAHKKQVRAPGDHDVLQIIQLVLKQNWFKLNNYYTTHIVFQWYINTIITN